LLGGVPMLGGGPWGSQEVQMGGGTFTGGEGVSKGGGGRGLGEPTVGGGENGQTKPLWVGYPGGVGDAAWGRKVRIGSRGGRGGG